MTDTAGTWLARLARRWRGSGEPPGRADGRRVALLALGVRLAVLAWAWRRFPPVDDGTFYDVVARRIAEGLGYTWAWPDGTVTYAAHYPVGYPALVGAAYALCGARPAAAMLLNALVGAGGAWAAYALASRTASRRGAWIAGLLVALEPALVLYTPALMTEAVAGELFLLAAACATAARPSPLGRGVLSGLLLGGAVLVRPQLLLAAPFVGAAVAWREATLRRALRGAAVVTALSVAVCLPWSARNCARLDTCAFVSANGGWNLYIGASPLGEGGWAPLERIGVPAACRTVFGEGGKDRCFGRAGLAIIAADPRAWLALVPKKLGATFDYGTAAAHYLAASNPGLITPAVKVTIGALELFGQRVLLLFALLALGTSEGPRARARAVLAPVGALASLLPFAWVGWLVLVVQGSCWGARALARPNLLIGVGLIAVTALTHAVFFGAGRYALVCLPALGALGAVGWPRAAPNRAASAGLTG